MIRGPPSSSVFRSWAASELYKSRGPRGALPGPSPRLPARACGPISSPHPASSPRERRQSAASRPLKGQFGSGHGPPGEGRGCAGGAEVGDLVSGWALSLIHISEPTRPYSSSYAVLCLKKNTQRERSPESHYAYQTHKRGRSKHIIITRISKTHTDLQRKRSKH